MPSGQHNLKPPGTRMRNQLLRRYKDGVDRIDNVIGYKLDNCVTCCGTCNIAKRSMTQQQFINWISRTYNNLKERNIL